MTKVKDILMTFDKERLVALVEELIDKPADREKIDFISKNIDTRLALESINKGDGKNSIKEVKKFCADCLDEEYYYDDYWDSYDESVFEGQEWGSRYN